MQIIFFVKNACFLEKAAIPWCINKRRAVCKSFSSLEVNILLGIRTPGTIKNVHLQILQSASSYQQLATPHFSEGKVRTFYRWFQKLRAGNFVSLFLVLVFSGAYFTFFFFTFTLSQVFGKEQECDVFSKNGCRVVGYRCTKLIGSLWFAHCLYIGANM